MGAGFVVDSETLRQHSGRVQAVAADVRTAQSAASTTGLHGGAFGMLCSFLPLVVSGVDSAAHEALAAVGTATDGVVTELGSMARAFDAVDERVEALLQAVAKAIDR